MYERSTKTKPEDLHAWVDAAVLFEVLGDYSKAASLWEQAYKIRGDKTIYSMHASRLNSLAELNSGDFKESEKAELLYRVGGLFHGVNKPEQALEYLRQSVAVDPQRATTWSDLAEIAAEVGLYREAISAADQALAIQPDLQGAMNVKNMLEDVMR